MRTVKAKLKQALMALANRGVLRVDGYAFSVSPRTVPRSRRRVCVFYVSTVGSLGDAAMGYSVISQIQTRLPETEINLLIHRDDDAAYFDDYGVEITSMQGLFSTMPNRDACQRVATALANCDDLIICGADVLDGGYTAAGSIRKLFLGEVAQHHGARVHVIGFSFSDRADPWVKRYLRENCADFKFVCRDPLSADRVSNVLQRPIEIGADLAFLLPIPDAACHAQAQAAEAQVAKWRAAGRSVLAFNANPLSFLKSCPHLSLETAAERLSEGLASLAASENAAILLLTHDNRPAHSDAGFMARIESRLPTEVERLFLAETVQPTDIKRLCRMVDFVVTGRMHLGIAALGAGTPALVANYQGKVQGLMQLFGTPDLALDLEATLSAEGFAAIVRDRWKRKAEFATRIVARLPAVQDLARRNLTKFFEAEAGADTNGTNLRKNSFKNCLF